MSAENKSLTEQLKKAVDAGVSLAQKTWDEVETRRKRIVEKLPEKEAAGLLKGFQQTIEHTHKKFETRVSQVVKDVLKKANLVTAEDLKPIRRELQALKKDIQAMKAPKGGKIKASKAATTTKTSKALKAPAATTTKTSKAPRAPRLKKSS
jgi:polyhydroxyalkanoate synthesis regulator phasin